MRQILIEFPSTLAALRAKGRRALLRIDVPGQAQDDLLTEANWPTPGAFPHSVQSGLPMHETDVAVSALP